MKVLKFGGTSVGTVESLKNVKKIVDSLPDGCIVVVSALGGLTDRLILTANMAAQGNEDYSKEMDAMSKRHFDIIEGVIAPEKQEAVKQTVGNLLHSLRRLYDGIFLLREASETTMNNVVSFGERMSSPIVAAMIDGADLHYSPDFIKTEKWFGKNIADSAITTTMIQREFPTLPKRVAVMGGFISTDRDTNEITNLGRGGSDFTAALVAAALNAECLEIWTDVDGFMTADPRIIPAARLISQMSFVESMELCSFGAKVVYPPTIYPVFHKGIPIRILNTFNLEAPGTLITDSNGPDTFPVKGVSSLKQTCLVALQGDIAGDSTAVNSRTYNALARHGISVHVVDSAEGCRQGKPTFTFAVVDGDVDNALKALNQEFAPELTNGELDDIIITRQLATLAVVGEHLKEEQRLAPRILNTLQRNAIYPKAFSAGSSETTMTFVVDATDVEKGLKLIHGLCFGDEATECASDK